MSTVAEITRRTLRRFLKNPRFDIETGKLIGHDGDGFDLPKLEFVPAARSAPSNINVPMADGQIGPQFAGGGVGAIGLQSVDVLLSSAQILALQTGAITLLPAPPVGWHYVVRYIKMILLAGSAAYTDAGGAVSFTCGSQTIALASNAIFLVTTSPNRRIQNLDFLSAAVGTGVTGTAGNPPTEDAAAFTISKATNNFAAGNGTMKITLYYTIEPTT